MAMVGVSVCQCQEGSMTLQSFFTAFQALLMVQQTLQTADCRPHHTHGR